MLPYSLPIQGKTIKNRTQKISPSFHSSSLLLICFQWRKAEQREMQKVKAKMHFNLEKNSNPQTQN